MKYDFEHKSCKTFQRLQFRWSMTFGENLLSVFSFAISVDRPREKEENEHSGYILRPAERLVQEQRRPTR